MTPQLSQLPAACWTAIAETWNRFGTSVLRICELAAKRIVQWLGVCENKFYDWKQRYGRVNEHNGQVPRTMLRTVPGGSPTPRSSRSGSFTTRIPSKVIAG